MSPDHTPLSGLVTDSILFWLFAIQNQCNSVFLQPHNQVCVSVALDGVLGPPRLARNHRGSMHLFRHMKGVMSAQKALQGSETKTRE